MAYPEIRELVRNVDLTIGMTGPKVLEMRTALSATIAVLLAIVCLPHKTQFATNGTQLRGIINE